MTQPLITPSALIGLPAYPASGYAPLADRFKTLMQTKSDVVFVQAEAIVTLEASAASLGRQGLVALNIVTSPYGTYYGEWLRRAGAEVHELVASEGKPVTVAEVSQALDALPQLDLAAVVHAETSTGILNPLPDIAALVKKRKALLVVDAVASVGGHVLDVDALGIDVCVIGPQKSLGGPAGLSIVSVSSAAWSAIERAASPSPSTLNLLDFKTGWLDKGRGAVPGMPSAQEFWSLEAALQAIEQEGLTEVIVRHERISKATRAGFQALGVRIWVQTDSEASNLATAFQVPQNIDPQAVITKASAFGAVVLPAHGSPGARLLRVDHTGARASFAPALANVVGAGLALKDLGATVNIGAAAEAFALA